MSEQCQDTPRCVPDNQPHVMSIHTRKITDSCRDKDCIEDLRVYLTHGSQAILDTAASARVRCAELIYTDIEVEPAAFDHKHYCIEVTFFYRILADATVCGGRSSTITGLAVFSKRAVLCGEDSQAHIYSSDTRLCGTDGPTRLRPSAPTAIVEVLDPMVLGSRLKDVCHCNDPSPCPIPKAIQQQFDEDLSFCGDKKRLYVTLGQFSIIRLERDAQIIVPILNYSLPTKQCSDCPGCGEDPCEMFSKIPFPEKQFNPTECDNSCAPRDIPSSGHRC